MDLSSVQKVRIITLIGLLTLSAGVKLVFLHGGILVLSESWFSLLLVVLAGVSLALRANSAEVQVLCLLLVSLAVLFSGIDADQLLADGTWFAWLLHFFWQALIHLFPFVFVHFSLIFPISTPWVARRRVLWVWLYIPYGVLLAAVAADIRAIDIVLILSLPAGLLLGSVVFLRQYAVSLSGAERNRIRMVLIGCLAGAVPKMISLLGSHHLSEWMTTLADALLVLFPVSLVFAVLKENFSRISRVVHALLVYSLATSLALSLLFTFHWGFSWLAGSGWNPGAAATAMSLLITLAITFPITRRMRRYFSQQFYTPRGPRPLSMASPIAFRRVEPNPYIVGNPVRSAKMFFGREEEFQFIRNRLRDEHSGCVIVLYGERRAGKTSILYQLLNGRLGSAFLPVFVDVQGLIVDRDREFVQCLVAQFIRALRGDDPKPDPVAFADAETYPQFTTFIDTVARARPNQRLLLLLDEYELLESKVESGKLSPELYLYFGSLLEHCPRLSLVLTGSRTLHQFEAWEPLLGRAFHRNISFLGRRDAEALISAPLAGRVTVPGDIVDDLIRLTRGHPFFVQFLCQLMVEVVNERTQAAVDRAIVSELLKRALDNPPPQLIYQWASVDNTQRLVLSSVATLLKRQEDYVAPERVGRLIQSLPPAFRDLADVAEISMQCERLRQRNILERDQTRYRFSMDFVRLWIRNEHNVWNVLDTIQRADPVYSSET